MNRQPGEAFGRAVELTLFYFLAPLLVLTGIWPSRLKMLLLLLVALWAIAVAWRRQAPLATLGLGANGRRELPPALRIGLSIWALCFLLAALFQRMAGHRLFPLVESKPLFFLLICIVYAGSVAVQEFLFRSFYFWRYDGLLARWLLIALNILSFGWMHIVFGSWISVALTIIGGAIFDCVYLRHRSLIGVCIVHLAFGLSVFAMGYGKYFYGASDLVARALQSIAP